MDPRSSESGSNCVHVKIRFRSQTKALKLSGGAKTRLCSIANLHKLIFEQFPKVEDELKSGPLVISRRRVRESAPQRHLEVKWKDATGNLVALANDAGLVAADLAHKTHVELRIILPFPNDRSQTSHGNSSRNCVGELSRGCSSKQKSNDSSQHLQVGKLKNADIQHSSTNCVDSRSWRNGKILLPQRNGGNLHRVHTVNDGNFRPTLGSGPSRTALPTSDLEINNWLMKKMELAGGRSIAELSEGQTYDVLCSIVERKRLNPDTMDLIVRVLTKDEIRTSLLSQKVNKIYGALLGSAFLHQLQSHITSHLGIRNPNPKALQPYLFLIEELQSRTEEGWKDVPLDAMHAVVSKLAEGNEKVALVAMVSRLLQQREKQQRLLAVAPSDNSLEDAEFREMAIVASKDELNRRELKADLPVNRIGIQYSKLCDYLHTHFILLREDCIDPLRQAIAIYKSNNSNARGGHRVKNVDELRIYSDVNVAAVRCGREGMEHVFKFKISKGEKTANKWESSRRLMSGSLLCISSDTFQTFFWGVVSRQNVEELAKGLVTVRIVEGNDDVWRQEALLMSRQKYIMVESTAAYFEAYSHVLKNLQREEMDKLPFTNYLLHLQPEVQPPAYLLRRSDGDEYDFSSAFPQVGENLGKKSIRVLHAEWPAGISDALGLDRAQVAALKQGLTKELALIQGPPGTGKTFLGIHLVKLLLSNLKRRPVGRAMNVKGDSHDYDLTGPILIICYTNHALDQFLEGLYNSGQKDIIRIGSRSKSEVLKTRSLERLLESQRGEKKVDGNHHRFRNEERARKGELQDEIDECMEAMGQKFLSYRSIQGVATAAQIRNLYGVGMPRLAASTRLMEFWLSEEWYVEDHVALQHYLNLEESEDATRDARFKVPANQARGSAAVVGRDSMKMLPEDNGEWKIVERRARNRRRASNQHAADDVDPQPQSILQNYIEDSDFDAMDDAELRELDMSNVWDLNLPQRRRLHAYWLLEVRTKCRRRLRKLKASYQEACRYATEVDKEIQVSMLRTAKIVGMTTTGAAKHHDVVRSLNSEIVIIEEAAEVLEGHTLACLSPSVQQLILIGDHLQLRPKVAVYRLSTQYNLDVSMFERLIRGGVEKVTLQEQRRMRPSISKLMRSLYPGSRDHESVLQRKEVSGVSQNVFFFDHRAQELTSEGDGVSKVNPTEARLVVELCMYLLNQADYGPKNITILTMYTGQLMEIRGLLTERCKKRLGVRPVGEKAREKENGKVLPASETRIPPPIPRVSSVDDFQGEESDIIILSLVRSNEIVTNKGVGKIGFLEAENRICVALTRAREGFFIFGNATLLAEKSTLWRTVTDSLQDDSALGQHLELYCKNHPQTKTSITKAEDFKQVEDGGCGVACDCQLDCGHACPRRCHHISHDLIVCPKPCLKPYKNCDHICMLLCHNDSPCPPCNVKVRRVLPSCGHENGMNCHANVEDVICMEACEKILSCGHKCQNKCGKPCTELCEARVDISLPCGHRTRVPCSKSAEERQCSVPCQQLLKECQHPCGGSCGKCKQGTAHIACTRKCGRRLVCGHSCEEKCSAPCLPCKKKCPKRCPHSKCQKLCVELCRPCREKCAWRCEHHKCEKFCHEICTRPRCDFPCQETIQECGHPCIGLCGEPCPSKCRVCHPETLDIITQMKLGEYEETDRFIELEDCEHVFEVCGLDTWMRVSDATSEQGGSVAIKLKECPECRTPIMKTTRYSNSVKLKLSQIEQVKRKMLGYENLRQGNDHLAEKDHDLALRCYRTALNYCPDLMDAQFQIGQVFFLKNENPKAIIQFCFVIERSSSANSLQKLLNRVQLDILASAKPITVPITIEGKIHPGVRAGRAKDTNIRDMKTHLSKFPGRANDGLAMKAMEQLASTLSSTAKFYDATEVSEAILERDPENRVAKAVKERRELKLVIRALEKDVGMRGHWFQCPNGHLYTIGECGGATEISRCPDCNAEVGGSSHRLAAGNRPSNIDGSDPSAYQWGGNQPL